MHKLLENAPGKEMLLLGNEAIARGALEAGVAFATCYPGTPSSEIPEQFFAISKETDLYFEYSTNEKVAMEVGAGAALTGVRTMVTMKHVGLNVASDPLMTLAYTGVKGGMVVINADDPSLFSSQNEQDNRYYARLSGLPMLEPTNTQEMKDITIFAFDLSEQLEVPVMVRTTTRLAHIRGAVKLGDMKPRKTKGFFKKNPFHFVCVPAVSRNLHKELLEKYDKALAISEKSNWNQIIGKGKWGIVANGVCVDYAMDAVTDLGIKDKVSFLKLGFSWPMPKELITRFLKQVDKVLVVEELEPIFENELKAIAQEKGITIPIQGKGVAKLSRLFEYDPRMVREAVAQFFGVSFSFKAPVRRLGSAAPSGETPDPLPGLPPPGHLLCGEAGLRNGGGLSHGHRLLHPGASASHLHGRLRDLHGLLGELLLRFLQGERPEGGGLHRGFHLLPLGHHGARQRGPQQPQVHAGDPGQRNDRHDRPSAPSGHGCLRPGREPSPDLHRSGGEGCGGTGRPRDQALQREKDHGGHQGVPRV